MNLHAIVGVGVLKYPYIRNRIPVLRRYFVHALYAVQFTIRLTAKVDCYWREKRLCARYARKL